MKVPFNGNVNARLLKKLYRDKVFYCVRENHLEKYIFSPCFLSDCEWSIDFPFVKFIKREMPFDERFSNGARWENLFETYEEAREEAKRRNYLYFECFRYKPYLKLEMLEEHLKDFMYIESQLDKCLCGFENFQGIDFCNVGAGGIQIRGHHKQISGYTYGSQPTIKYDFSNVEEVICEFIDMWRRNDTEEEIIKEKRFIYYGEKYGWD